MMGNKTMFPGGNDNASGTSMLLNLMQYFSNPANKPPFTLVFISFAAEEAGLLGSEYYTEHPTKDLSKIKFLLNLDLMGTGDDGIMVVNGSVYEKEFTVLEKINAEQKLLKTIGKRGKAQNSDHYYFTEKGVPSFFLYTTGGRTAYHDIYDDGPGLPLTKFKEVFTLISTFIKTIN
jgi:Zn-dependent M28 family amino/carboxypeptidase